MKHKKDNKSELSMEDIKKDIQYLRRNGVTAKAAREYYEETGTYLTQFIKIPRN